MKIKIYVEGGGGNKADQKTECRKGFSKLFAKVLKNGKKPAIVACGSRDEAIKGFIKAAKNYQNQMSLLLVDSEGPVPQGINKWSFVNQDHDWSLESKEDQERVFLMVQLMEAWFLADKDGLAEYFGQGFNGNALAKNRNIEEIPKQQVSEGLKNATPLSGKGKYKKSSHSYEILGLIDPRKVEQASIHAAALFQKLREICR